MADSLIDRAEVVALLFNVSESRIRSSTSSSCSKKTMAKKKLTKAERAERDADLQRMRANAQRTRELAERAQAKLDAQSKSD
jgi:hypothetical protein